MLAPGRERGDLPEAGVSAWDRRFAADPGGGGGGARRDDLGAGRRRGARRAGVRDPIGIDQPGRRGQLPTSFLERVMHFPAYRGRAGRRRERRQAACLSNAKQIALACRMCAQDWDEVNVPERLWLPKGNLISFRALLQPYV